MTAQAADKTPLFAAIYLPSQDELRLVEDAGLSSEVREKLPGVLPLSIREMQAGFPAAEPLLLKNGNDLPEGLPPALLDLPKQLNCPEVALLPIVHEGDLAGLLLLASHEPEGITPSALEALSVLTGSLATLVLKARLAERDQWSPEELESIEAVSDQAALPLESARLLEEAQRRVEREQTLSELTTTFSRSLDLDALMQTVVRELGKLPKVREVSIHVSPPDGASSDTDEENAA